jgi:hypothetical protein
MAGISAHSVLYFIARNSDKQGCSHPRSSERDCPGRIRGCAGGHRHSERHVHGNCVARRACLAHYGRRSFSGWRWICNSVRSRSTTVVGYRLDVVVGAKHSISNALWMYEVGWRMLRPYPGITRRCVHGWESQGHGTPCLYARRMERRWSLYLHIRESAPKSKGQPQTGWPFSQVK